MRLTRHWNGALGRRDAEPPSRWARAFVGRAAVELIMVVVCAGVSGAAMAADDGQWPIPAKNYANTRYSELTQINTENVKSLKLAWTFDTGVRRGQESAPIVVGQTMYVVTPYPNVLYALDLK